MNHPVHKTLKAAYSFYNVSTETPLLDLMQNALILAKKVRFWTYYIYSSKILYVHTYEFVETVAILEKGLLSMQKSSYIVR